MATNYINTKPVKEATKRFLNMTKGEIEAYLTTPSCTAAERLAGVVVLRELDEDRATPNGLQVLTKLTGDMQEEVHIETNKFTELVREISSEDEF